MPTSRLGAALAAAALLAAPLAAQQVDTLPRDTVTTLPTIEVVGSILTQAGPGIGSGVPARTSTITSEQLEAWEPRVFSDLLGSQPGFSLYDDLGSPFKTTVHTRGFFASPVVGLPQGVSVFLDGVPVNEADAAQVNFDLLPLEHVRRVELLSGTASLLGPNSLGGSINLLTNHGGGPTQGEIEVTGGSYESFSAEGSVGGSSSGWNFYGGGGYTTEDGWRQVTGAEGYNGFANIGRSGPRSGFNLQLLGAKSRVETAGSLPLSIFTVNPTPTCRLSTSRIWSSGTSHSQDTARSGPAADLPGCTTGATTPSGSTSTRSTTRTSGASVRTGPLEPRPTGTMRRPSVAAR